MGEFVTLQQESDHFEPALAGSMTGMQLGDGRLLSLQTHRWHCAPDTADEWLIERCYGSTIDLGCGPGRLVHALAQRGFDSLGVDCSPHAIRQCRARGVSVLQSDVFGALPYEGAWQHVLLADGNIGIGGDPLLLLRRAAELLAAGGTLLTELAAPGAGYWTGPARLANDDHQGQWFPWAVVGIDVIAALADRAGLQVREVATFRRRWFAELTRSDTVRLALNCHIRQQRG
jgi:SAM-dependent methyltransferase